LSTLDVTCCGRRRTPGVARVLFGASAVSWYGCHVGCYEPERPPADVKPTAWSVVCGSCEFVRFVARCVMTLTDGTLPPASGHTLQGRMGGDCFRSGWEWMFFSGNEPTKPAAGWSADLEPAGNGILLKRGGGCPAGKRTGVAMWSQLAILSPGHVVHRGENVLARPLRSHGISNRRDHFLEQPLLAASGAHHRRSFCRLDQMPSDVA
jgi:hypothetical protein